MENNNEKITAKFYVGKKYVIADLNLKSGQNPEKLIDDLFSQQNIPRGDVEISLLSGLSSLISEERKIEDQSTETNDLSSLVSDPKHMQSSANNLAKRFENFSAEFSNIQKNLSHSSSTLVTFGEAYQFLLQSVQSTRDSLHQLELNYRRSMAELVQKYQDSKAELEQKQSEEMQAASAEIDVENKVAALVNKHLQEMEEIESTFTLEFEKTKVKQKAEFHDFVMNFYHIESTRVQEKVSPIPSSEADDFVNIGVNSPNATPVRPSNSFSKIYKKKDKITTFIPTFFKKKKEKTSTITPALVPVNVTVSDLSESVLKEISETFTVCVDQSDPSILYSLRITDLNLFQLCTLENENEFSITTVYGDSLKAGVLLVDRELSFKTKSNKEFMKLCNASTEFHFDDVEDQIRNVKEKLKKGGKELQEAIGDCFVTRHSNLSEAQVVFHLVVDPKKNKLENPISSNSKILSGIRTILQTGCLYDIEYITLPLLLLETDENLLLTPELEAEVLGRASAVLQGVKLFLQMKRTEDLKGLRFTIPSNIYNAEGFLKKLSILVAQNFYVVSNGPPLWEK